MRGVEGEPKGRPGRPPLKPRNKLSRALAEAEAQGYTRAELARWFGVHLATYGAWRRGERQPSGNLEQEAIFGMLRSLKPDRRKKKTR
jgi:transposase-like protein